MDFIFIIVMGGLWGSFANVCIYRLPQNKGVVSGRSYCPKCKTQISWYDNIPILSYLFIQGKCRKCKKKISVQYLIVELLSILSFVAAYFFLWNNYYNIVVYNFSLNIYHNFFY